MIHISTFDSLHRKTQRSLPAVTSRIPKQGAVGDECTMEQGAVLLTMLNPWSIREPQDSPVIRLVVVDENNAQQGAQQAVH